MSKRDKKTKDGKSKKTKAKKAKGQKAASQSETLGLRSTDQKLQSKNIGRKEYEKRLAELHIELVKLQHWIVHKQMKCVILFEGRDASALIHVFVA